MRLCVAAWTLCLAVAQADVWPRRHIVPASQLKPTYTDAEWQQVLANQVQKPEAYPKFKPGKVRQIEGAGAIRGSSRDSDIVGAANVGQFPWQVAISVDDSWFCGGSLISQDWVLTTAHCANRASFFVLGLGSLAPDSGSEGSLSIIATNYIVHEDYQPLRIANDVAVIRLDTPLKYSQIIGPVRLPRKSQANTTFSDVMARVSGWGPTSHGNRMSAGASPPDVCHRKEDSACEPLRDWSQRPYLTSISQTLKWFESRVITNAECSTYFRGVLDNQICTSGKDMTSICSGDSGGPLVLREDDGLYTEIGVVSYGASAGCELGFPQGYSRVTSFLEWIETHTGIIMRN